MTILSGSQLAKNLINDIKTETANLTRKPGIAVILIGNYLPSVIYVKNKQRACRDVGFYTVKITKSSTITQAEVLAIIKRFNNDSNIDGILLQLPLPSHLNSSALLQSISPLKDVDGFNYQNGGRLLQNKPFLRPCAPKGVMQLLDNAGIKVEGKHCVVVGASNIVGRPMALELLNQGATITVCNSKTENLAAYTKIADVIVMAVGKAKILTADMVKSGVVVIDIGINRLSNGSLVGDADFLNVADKASFITPVPGGVGPMTIASLLQNTLIAYKN